MRKEETTNKEKIVQAVIDNLLEKKQPKEIKTPYIEKYETPAGLKARNGNKTFVPDITAIFDDSSNLYEIELDDDFQVNKWKLFSIYARERNGKLFLVVPEWLKESVKKELVDKNIHAGIIFFNA